MHSVARANLCCVRWIYKPGCIPCKTHAGVTPVAPQVYAKVEGLRTPEVQRSKEPFIEIYILLRQQAKEYSLSNIQADRTANSTPKYFDPKIYENSHYTFSKRRIFFTFSQDVS